jgi:hypothetical protein
MSPSFGERYLITLYRILAVLLGRLNLTLPDCILDYSRLSAHILRDGIGPPIFSRTKLLHESRQIVTRRVEPQQPDTTHKRTVSLIPSTGDLTRKTYGAIRVCIFEN